MQLLASSVVNYTQGVVLSILFGLLTLLSIFFAIFYIVRFGGESKDDSEGISLGKKVYSIKKVMLIILLVGIVVRIVCGLLVIGHRREFAENIYYTLRYVSKYDETDTNKILYPLTYYVMQIFAGIWINAGVSTDAVLLNFSIKIPFIIADVITAILLLKTAKQYFNQKVALVFFALVMLCPLFVFVSVVWGSVITLIAPPILLAINLLLSKKHAFSIIAFVVATLLAKEAVILIPVLLVYFGYVWVKSIRAVSSKKFDKEDKLNSWTIPLVTAFCVGFGYLLCLAYTSQFNMYSFAEVINEFYIRPFTNVFYYGENVANIYVLFGKSETVPNMWIPTEFNATLMFVLFIALIIVIASAIFFAKKNRATIVLVMAYVLLTINVYYVGLTAISILPTLALLLFAYLIIKDKRILKTFTVCAVSMMIVALAVFTVAGYFNTEPLSFFKSSSYTGQTYLTGDYSIPLITASVFQVLNHLYMSFYIFDITYGKHVQLLDYNAKCTISDVMYTIFSK